MLIGNTGFDQTLIRSFHKGRRAGHRVLGQPFWHRYSYPIFSLIRIESGTILLSTGTVVPTVAKILPPPIFSNLHILGTKADTTNVHEINPIDICSIY